MQRISFTSLILLLFAGLSGCSTDNRAQIGMKTLYQDEAVVIAHATPKRPFPVLTGALNAKFMGSESQKLEDYVLTLNGRCEKSGPAQPISCSFVESGATCVRTSVSVIARIDDFDKINGIEAWHIIEGC